MKLNLRRLVGRVSWGGCGGRHCFHICRDHWHGWIHRRHDGRNLLVVVLVVVVVVKQRYRSKECHEFMSGTGRTGRDGGYHRGGGW